MKKRVVKNHYKKLVNKDKISLTIPDDPLIRNLVTSPIGTDPERDDFAKKIWNKARSQETNIEIHES